ncbi:hypothetical protein PTTG_27751 [Puccinia triticina 1-1 BBBD Race 1]|uniref:Uncharacterized protein n=1 Tax=Puccinia triticina (isolate 1-1 / race 1 (BBBD)) TaxID=630390 RepID=A0A180GHM5_PUCT1|nr:hypothetical protein PTTG_27751 [Puccinia triticina 1-1 BBBD Race 1]
MQAGTVPINPALSVTSEQRPHPAITGLIAEIRSRETSVARGSTAAVERQLLGEPICLNSTVRGGSPDSIESIVVVTKPINPPNPPSSQPASFNVAEAAARRGWNPTKELLLQTHLRFKQAFLEAWAGNNQESMILLRDQAITTHNSLKRLISRDILLFLTKGWNPHVTHPNHPANNPANAETTAQGPKPPSSLCTPRSTPATTSGKPPTGTSSGRGSTPTGPIQPHEGAPRLPGVDLQQTVLHESHNSGRLPVD